MNKLILAATAALMAVGTALPAAAAVNARQLDQQRRIDAGARSGKLTPREVRTLKAEQRAIERRKAQLKLDGRYSSSDKRQIAAMQDRAEAHIVGQKRDGQRAPSKRVLGAKVF